MVRTASLYWSSPQISWKTFAVTFQATLCLLMAQSGANTSAGTVMNTSGSCIRTGPALRVFRFKVTNCFEEKQIRISILCYSSSPKWFGSWKPFIEDKVLDINFWTVENGYCCPCLIGISIVNFYKHKYLTWSLSWLVDVWVCLISTKELCDRFCVTVTFLKSGSVRLIILDQLYYVC